MVERNPINVSCYAAEINDVITPPRGVRGIAMIVCMSVCLSSPKSQKLQVRTYGIVIMYFRFCG